MKGIILMTLVFCMGGISTSFAIDITAEKFNFDGKIPKISFQKIMSDKKDSLQALPGFSEDNKVLRKVDFKKATQWYDYAPDYEYNYSDDTGHGWPLCVDKKKKWIQISTIEKITEREGNDVYVCDFRVKYIVSWRFCHKTNNPHTDPGRCSCDVRWKKDSEKNTGKCEWRASN